MYLESIKWYQSKTIWAGVIEFLIGVGLLLAEFFAKGNFGAPAIILLVVGVLTIALRMLTNTAIG